jgi:hypothetical protein
MADLAMIFLLQISFTLSPNLACCKDLENARMKLNEHANITNESVDSLEDVNLPLKEQNVIDLVTGDSEEESYVLTMKGPYLVLVIE